MSQKHANKQGSNDRPVSQNAIQECVRYIICREGSKIPIKRIEIQKYLSTSCELQANQINSVIIEANKLLKRVYGCKLVQVEVRSGVQYIVVLTEESESLTSTFTDPHQRRLLVAALTHIFMTGGPVKEDDMWKFLTEANLLEENDNAGRKILTNHFTRQMYLTYTKDGEGELARNVFQWGQRAVEELPKMFILTKMAQAFDKNPDNWCEQYKEAMDDTQQT